MNFSPVYPFLCSFRRLSLRLSVFVFVFVSVFVFVFVCEYFSFVFAPLIKALLLSNKQASETYIYIYMLQGRWWRHNLCQNTHQTPWESKPLYTPSEIIQKGFEFFNFLHFELHRIWKVNKYIRAYRTWLLLYAKHLKDVRGNRSNL